MDDLVNAHNYDDQIQAQRRAKANMRKSKEPMYDGRKQSLKKKHSEEDDEEESDYLSSDEED